MRNGSRGESRGDRWARRAAAFAGSVLLAVVVGLAVAIALRPWGVGLAFVGSLYVLVVVGAAAFWGAYRARSGRAALAATLGGTLLVVVILALV